MADPQFIEVKLYSHWASALINGDYSGLEDEEEGDLNEYLSEEAPKHDMFYCVGKADDNHFGRPDIPAWLPGDISTYTFQIA